MSNVISLVPSPPLQLSPLRNISSVICTAIDDSCSGGTKLICHRYGDLFPCL